VRERFAWSRTVTPQQNEDSESVREQFRANLLSLLDGGRIILLPTMPDVAPLLTDTDEALDAYRNQAIRMLCVAGLGRCPQLSLPLMQIDGVPLGLSLIGPPGSDRGLIELGRMLMA
jgi:amidase